MHRPFPADRKPVEHGEGVNPNEISDIIPRVFSSPEEGWDLSLCIENGHEDPPPPEPVPTKRAGQEPSGNHHKQIHEVPIEGVHRIACDSPADPLVHA